MMENFEDANKKLEEIIAKLENGVSLDEGVSLFEEGAGLTRFCYSKLDEAKGKIMVIRKTLESFTTEEMK